MEDFLNPVGPRNPNSHVGDAAKAVPQENAPQDNYEEGSESIPLPSRGVFYNKIGHFGKDEIWCRPLDFRDEDILTTKRYMEEGTVFDKLVDSVIQEKISAKNLVPVDRDTILLWLRTMAMGKDMTVDYGCPSCGDKQQATWDLSQLKMPEYDPEILEELQQNGEIKVLLPQANIHVFIVCPLISESKDTEKRYMKKKELEKFEHDMNATATLSLIVSGIEIPSEDENTPPRVIRRKDEILAHFKKIRLSLGDSRRIFTEAKKINLKYDTGKDLTCTKCGHIQEDVELPIIHQNFLWADLSS